MADLEDDVAQPLEGEPDLSDVVLAILNVETRDGKQYAFAVGLEHEYQHMDVQVTTTEDGPHEVSAGDGTSRIYPAYLNYSIVIARKG